MTQKLIYILNSYSEKDASHFTHVLHLLEVLAEQGCDVILVIEKPEGALPRIHERIQVVGLKSRLPVLRHLELFWLVSQLIRRGYTVSFVRITAAASIMASLAHKWRGGRSYLWQSGTTIEHDLAQPLSLRKLRWLLTSHLPSAAARRLVDCFVTGPELMVDYYATVAKVPRDKIRLLYNDIDLARFGTRSSAGEREQLCAELGVSPQATLLLLVHRLSPVRRSLMYLEPLLARLRDEAGRDWCLLVAGNGSELPHAKALVARLGLDSRVRFLGSVPNRQIQRLYGAADVFVHPTHAEGFPRVLIEAMAAGLPIVTTDAGGTAQLLGQAQTRFVVDRDRPQAFADKALELLHSPAEWAPLGQENRQVVRRFSTPEVATMYRKVLFS